MFGKKKAPAGEPVHIGKRLLWSGDVVSLCGRSRWSQKGGEDKAAYTSGKPTCEACKAESKKRWW